MNAEPADAKPASFINIAFDSGRLYQLHTIAKIIESTPAPLDRSTLLTLVYQSMTRTADSDRATFETTQTPLQEDR